MYSYLEGKISEKAPTEVVLDVGGVGYMIHIPVSTYGSLPNIGEKIRLLIHFVVREDFQALYGFSNEGERELFRLLISISGIGPKLGIMVLSGITTEELKKAINDGSVQVLTAITGIGKKTAERIIIELREKINLDGKNKTKERLHFSNVSDELIEDAIGALMSLGYKKQNAKDSVQKILKSKDAEKLSVEDIIRNALKHI